MRHKFRTVFAGELARECDAAGTSRRGQCVPERRRSIARSEDPAGSECGHHEWYISKLHPHASRASTERYVIYAILHVDRKLRSHVKNKPIGTYG